jgi:hypothetical protein
MSVGISVIRRQSVQDRHLVNARHLLRLRHVTVASVCKNPCKTLVVKGNFVLHVDQPKNQRMDVDGSIRFFLGGYHFPIRFLLDVGHFKSTSYEPDISQNVFTSSSIKGLHEWEIVLQLGFLQPIVHRFKLVFEYRYRPCKLLFISYLRMSILQVFPQLVDAGKDRCHLGVEKLLGFCMRFQNKCSIAFDLPQKNKNSHRSDNHRCPPTQCADQTARALAIGLCGDLDIGAGTNGINRYPGNGGEEQRANDYEIENCYLVHNLGNSTPALSRGVAA